MVVTFAEQRAWAARLFRCLTTSESGRALPPARATRTDPSHRGCIERNRAGPARVGSGHLRSAGLLLPDRRSDGGDWRRVGDRHRPRKPDRPLETAGRLGQGGERIRGLVQAPGARRRVTCQGTGGPLVRRDLLWAWTRRDTDGWNSDWAEQYGSGYPQAIAFLEESKRAREVQQRAEKERSELELRNARRQAEAERRAKRNYLVLAVALAALLGGRGAVGDSGAKSSGPRHASSKSALRVSPCSRIS